MWKFWIFQISAFSQWKRCWKSRNRSWENSFKLCFDVSLSGPRRRTDSGLSSGVCNIILFHFSCTSQATVQDPSASPPPYYDVVEKERLLNSSWIGPFIIVFFFCSCPFFNCFLNHCCSSMHSTNNWKEPWVYFWDLSLYSGLHYGNKLLAMLVIWLKICELHCAVVLERCE